MPTRPGWCRLLCGAGGVRGRLHRNADCAAEQSIESFDPEHLARKTMPKLREMDSATAFRSSCSAEFLLHRGDRLRRDAAGDDQVEVAEIGVHVEGEAVRGDEAGDVDADGGEFGFGGVRGRRSANSRSLDSRERFCESFSSARDDNGIGDPSRRRLGPELASLGLRSRRRCGSGLLPGGGRIRRRRESCVCRRASANPRRSKMG